MAAPWKCPGAGHGRVHGVTGGLRRSDKSELSERAVLPVGDDEMIEQAHLDQRQGPVELLGDAAVGLERFGHAAGVLGCIHGCKPHWVPPSDCLHWRAEQPRPRLEASSPARDHFGGMR